MANSKFRCLNCKCYFPQKYAIETPVGKFCCGKCRQEYGIQATETLRKKAKIIERKKFNEKKRQFKKTCKKTQRAKAQAAFNAYIRKRDEKLPCISCGRHHQGQYHAGHYKTRGAHPELAFHPFNCHKQCSACNNHLSGNISNYRPNLIDKIGLENVEWLESQHKPQLYTAEDLSEIADYYKEKLKELQ